MRDKKIFYFTAMAIQITLFCGCAYSVPKWDYLKTWTKTRIDGDTFYKFDIDQISNNRIALSVSSKETGIKYSQVRKDYRVIKKDSSVRTVTRYANLNCSKRNPCYTWDAAWPILQTENGGTWEKVGYVDGAWHKAINEEFIITSPFGKRSNIKTDDSGRFILSLPASVSDTDTIEIYKENKLVAEIFKDRGQFIVERTIE